MRRANGWAIKGFLSAALVSALAVINVAADEHSHKYTAAEDVVVWANSVGPLSNRQETYEYFQLPYCKGKGKVEHRHETLGEALLGMELINSGIPIKFPQNQVVLPICPEFTLTSQEIKTFSYAISHDYWFQYFIDDLPVWGMVGVKDDTTGRVSLFTHQRFEFEYNGNQVISARVKAESPVELVSSQNGMNVEFTYSVTWQETQTPFKSRFERYLDSDFFENKIHWFSIFNSLMMVLFLTGFVSAMWIRHLRRDFARYDKETGLNDFDHDLGDDYGWKQIHGDVFRPPANPMTFAAFVGTGHQLAWTSFFVILYTIFGQEWTERASIMTATIFIYAFTSMISGYSSSSQYSQYGGRDWVRAMFLTAAFWPGAVVLVTGLNNAVAIYYTSSRAIPFGTMVALLAIWIFIVLPLTFVGTLIGKNYAGKADFPCRVHPIPRPIPEKIWYAEPIVVIALGGILPFASIFIEIYFLFTSFWSYKVYYVYGFGLLVFGIVMLVTASVTVVSTYFVINTEDYRWHWMSMATCGSTAAYVYIYAVYYFMQKTKMYGLFQTSFYFGNTALACMAIFLMLGSVGHFAANKFIMRIYRNVKLD
ncbi:transmembrane 9 superfamily member 3 [Entomortierella parvispora]|uniref:Transmembrane 9 superfamily member n=1 Tax=Entomortierella parvispora TaxID=205924 RepID=A0A9P3HAI0_9FUNG|nr:transmembrane 9 superfamily member 3 [Entomortierella parvispora]